MLSNDSTRFRKACIFTTLRFVKTHALSLLGTTRLLSRSVCDGLAIPVTLENFPYIVKNLLAV